MNRAMQIRIAVALLLGAALAAFGLGSPLYTGGGAAGKAPFVIYSLTLTDPHLRVVHVRGRVFGSTARTVSLRAFAGSNGRRLEPIGLLATGPLGARLAVEAGDGTWNVASGAQDFSFEYDVGLTIGDRYAADVRDMMTFIGDDRSRILGKDVFLVPELPVAGGIIVDFAMRPGWRLAASSPSVRGRVIVNELAELPFTMAASGDYRTFARRIGECSIVLAIADSWAFSDDEFFDVLCRIVSEEIVLFGPSPRERYLFVCDRNPVMGAERFDYYGIHYGGSMMLLLDPRLDRSDLMDTPMAIIAHEFLHSWNGEELEPSGNGFLWFTEGVTNFCSYYVLREANVITAEQYENRRRAISERYRANPYTAKVPIGEAANSDMRDKDMVNLLYDGGFIAAQALDSRLRADSGGAVTLVDVVRRMCENTHGGARADEAAFLLAARELTGGDLSGYLREIVHEAAPKSLELASSSLE
jgi:predicted metalloprotease with PDZ domain